MKDWTTRSKTLWLLPFGPGLVSMEERPSSLPLFVWRYLIKSTSFLAKAIGLGPTV